MLFEDSFVSHLHENILFVNRKKFRLFWLNEILYTIVFNIPGCFHEPEYPSHRQGIYIYDVKCEMSCELFMNS